MFEKVKSLKLFVVVAIIALGLGGLAFVSQKSNSKNHQTTPLSINAIKNDISKGGQLIDVRTPEEYAAGHIDGSINLSLQDIQNGKYPTIAKNKTVYLYCRSGNRSNQARSILESAGYKSVVDLGAITHVQSLGGKLKK